MVGTVLRLVLLSWGVSRQGFGREPGDSCRKVALSRARLVWVCVTRFQAGKGDGLGRGFPVGSRHRLLRERERADSGHKEMAKKCV